MKKYITLMNPYTFYYLWNSKFKTYIEDLIIDITKDKDTYELIETFNNITNNLKSYVILESKNNILYLDFNHEQNNTIEDSLIILDYLTTISDKKVIMIVFNSFKGIPQFKDNIYYIYKNKNNNEFLKLLLSRNFKEQSKTELNDILDYLYSLDDKFYKSYLREEKLMEKHL